MTSTNEFYEGESEEEELDIEKENEKLYQQLLENLGCNKEDKDESEEEKKEEEKKEEGNKEEEKKDEEKKEEINKEEEKKEEEKKEEEKKEEVKIEEEKKEEEKKDEEKKEEEKKEEEKIEVEKKEEVKKEKKKKKKKLKKKEEKKEEKPEIFKAFELHSKRKKLFDSSILDFKSKPKSDKSLYNRLNDLQNELNSVSQEIKDYMQANGDNILLKEETNYDEISKELELYSSKLESIMSSDLYKNSISSNNQLSTDTNQLKEEIKKNLENYTNSTARLMSLINKEKEDFMIQNSVNSINTTTHEMFINKNLFNNNLNIDLNTNIDNEILEIEKELTKIENIVGKKKLSINEEINLRKTLKELIKIISNKTFQLRKKTVLDELNNILDELGRAKEVSEDINVYTLKIKELYDIYEVYENYDEILHYIKKRLMAISDMHEKSTNFNNDLEFLKKLIEDNEKQLVVLGKRYNETFEELSGLDEILKELKTIDNYFAPLLVD